MRRSWTVGGTLALGVSISLLTVLASAQDAGAPAPPPPATTIIVVPTPPPPAPAADTAAPAAGAPAASGKPAVVARPMSEQPPLYRPAGVRRRKVVAARAAVLGPVANYPGFRMLDGGASRVFVSVDRKVEVTEHKAEGRLTYRLKGVQAPVRTNRLPLLTSFFPTPVGRVQLVEQGTDVDVVIDLRMPSSAQYKLIEQNGGILLQVDFPKPAAGSVAALAPQAAAPPPSAKRTQNTTTIKGGASD